MDLFQYIDYIFDLLFGASFFIGLICYVVIGPLLIEKYGRDRMSAFYSSVKNFLYLEKELKIIASKSGNRIVKTTLIIINICKIVVVLYIVWVLYWIFCTQFVG